LTASYQEDHHPGAWPAYAAAGCGLAAAVCALLLLRARSNDAVWRVYEREHTGRGAVTQAHTLLDELRRIARRVSVLAADVDTRAIAAAAKLDDIMKRLQQQHRQVVAEMEQNAQIAEEIRRADEARKALAGLEEVTKQLSNLTADIRAEADAQVATADNLAARVEKLLTTAGRGAGAPQYSVDPANQETVSGVERKPVAGRLA
jgi:DNA repair exonuclease SbcCD ATPase subunit